MTPRRHPARFIDIALANPILSLLDRRILRAIDRTYTTRRAEGDAGFSAIDVHNDLQAWAKAAKSPQDITLPDVQATLAELVKAGVIIKRAGEYRRPDGAPADPPEPSTGPAPLDPTLKATDGQTPDWWPKMAAILADGPLTTRDVSTRLGQEATWRLGQMQKAGLVTSSPGPKGGWGRAPSVWTLTASGRALLPAPQDAAPGAVEGEPQQIGAVVELVMQDEPATPPLMVRTNRALAEEVVGLTVRAEQAERERDEAVAARKEVCAELVDLREKLRQRDGTSSKVIKMLADVVGPVALVDRRADDAELLAGEAVRQIGYQTSALGEFQRMHEHLIRTLGAVPGTTCSAIVKQVRTLSIEKSTADIAVRQVNDLLSAQGIPDGPLADRVQALIHRPRATTCLECLINEAETALKALGATVERDVSGVMLVVRAYPGSPFAISVAPRSVARLEYTDGRGYVRGTEDVTPSTLLATAKRAFVEITKAELDVLRATAARLESLTAGVPS